MLIQSQTCVEVQKWEVGMFLIALPTLHVTTRVYLPEV